MARSWPEGWQLWDEVRYRLRMPCDGWLSTRYAVRDFLTRDQPLGHGLTDMQTAPKFYFWRGPWWVKPLTGLLDVADVVTGHQFCSEHIDAQDRLLARHATRTTVDLDPVDVRHWKVFISGPPHEVEDHGPYSPEQHDGSWREVLGAYWFCTGCGVLVGRRRPGQHGVCTDCGTEMLPQGEEKR